MNRERPRIRRQSRICSFRVGMLTALALFVLFPRLVQKSEAQQSPNDAQAAQAAAKQFDRRIAPILKAHCWECHDTKHKEAGLDLSTRSGILTGGESGEAIVAGRPAESLLLARIEAAEMPPSDQNDPLSQAEINEIRQWIEAGAPIAAGSRELGPDALSQHDILPILELRCTACHGLRRQMAELDLRNIDGLLRGGKKGTAVVAGDPTASRLHERIAQGLCPPHKDLLDYGVKLPTPAEIARVRQWIEAGAAVAENSPAIEVAKITDEERRFWAFQPPQQVPPPRAEPVQWLRNPIDAFVLDKLNQQGLLPAPEAERWVLLRRAYFDLTGLPPTALELEIVLADARPDWYEQLIDRLLASPRYGERWGRFWLDLCGYADSEGKTDQDLDRPEAWRYRDYVIRSLNEDKPYDRFLREQLAGDELHDFERAGQITPEIYECLVATGFLRMGPDGTWTRDSNLVPERLDVIADALDVVSEGLLGLTMKCARCHDHKYDPIPQRDYYRLRDVFKGALDEHDWMRPSQAREINYASHNFPPRDLPHVTADERRAWEADQREADRLEAEIKSRKDDPASKQWVDEQQNRLKTLRRPEPVIRALWDRGNPSRTYILRRGDHDKFGWPVTPGVPAVLDVDDGGLQPKPPYAGARSTGRRLAFAHWLTRPDHPLTTRVLVNRLWFHHFGRGLVTTLNNFGRSGAAPSHPELLDWLAVEFSRSGWSQKRMHRLIVTSSTYRQASHVTHSAAERDPDNVWLSHMPLRRLDAEQLRDTLLFVAGRLDETPFGPGEQVTVQPDGQVAARGKNPTSRRSIYLRQHRKSVPTILATFDFPEMSPNCLVRPVSTVAHQALFLMNNEQVYELAQALATDVERNVAPRSRQIEHLQWRLMGRAPSLEEAHLAEKHLELLAAQWQQASPDLTRGLSPGSLALETYCHVLLNTAGLLYIE